MNAYVRACMGSLGGRQHLASGYLAVALVDPDKTIPTFVALMGGFRSTLKWYVCMYGRGGVVKLFHLGREGNSTYGFENRLCVRCMILVFFYRCHLALTRWPASC